MAVEYLTAGGTEDLGLPAAAAGVSPSYPDLIENLPVALCACDTERRILWFNARAVQLWGREPRVGDDAEEYCGSHRLGADRRSSIGGETSLERALRTGAPLRETEAKIERPDGSLSWASVHIEPMMDRGMTVGAIVSFHDMTSRVQAEELLRQQNRRLAATWERAGIGISEVDADGKLLKVNGHLAALLGYAPDELLDRSIFDSKLTDMAEEDEARFRRQVAGELSRYTVEKLFRRRDGGQLWVSITSSSVCDDEGKFLYAVRVQEDITARKIAEAALARRAEEQAALFEFSEALQRAGDVDDICAEALTAILRAVRCDRASVLLFDEAGVMKFVEWRGLSDGYRAAVEGHSPWRADARDPKPIFIEDFAGADLGDDLKATVRSEGIAALAFIPVVGSGRLFGKFMTYYDRPHAYTEAEQELSVIIARQLGVALERARAERAAQQLVAIVTSSHDAIVSKDLNGIIRTWNDGATRLFGYSAEEAIGQPITIVIPPDRLDEEPAILGRIRRGESVDHFETVRRRKDGTVLDVSLTISPVRDVHGQIVGASKIVRDISERKEAEAKLLDSERRLKELLAAIPAAIYTTDAQGRVTYYNELAVELAGRTPALGRDEWCVTWKLFRPDGTPMPHDQCPMAVALREGRAIRNAEAIAERPDGTRVPFIPYPTPLRDAKGNIVGAINMLVDVSERKQAESQQRVLFNELNHRVKNNMQMLQSVLNMAGRKTSNTEAQKILQEASRRVAAMAAAQQVLYGATDAIRFNAGDFLEAVCNTVRPTLPREVQILCQSTDVMLSNDVAMPLALIVNELLTNAAKYGANGSGQAAVRLGLTRQDDSYLLYVEDEGPGFDIQSVRRRNSGLQLVEGLARQLRGKFEVSGTSPTRCTLRFS